jgi:hypothetical protein
MLIRKFSWFLVFVCAFFVYSDLYLVQAQVNLLKNADFEDATDAPWTWWVEDTAITATTTKSLDKTEKMTGNQSLLINITKAGSGKRVELHQNPFSLKNGQKLTFAFWAKVSKGETRLANMTSNIREAPWTGFGSKAITITDSWTEFSVPVAMTADSEKVGVYVELKDTAGKTWFDRFRFYVGDYVKENLVVVVPSAVSPNSKIASTWSEIKSGFRD